MLPKYFSSLIIVIAVFFLSGNNYSYYGSGDNSSNYKLIATSDIDSCFYDGIPLHGKVKFVTSFPDIKVKFVNSFPDLKVKFVSSFPDQCGEWQIVESFPDFTIQVVESFPDIEIKAVNSFPGIP